MYERQQPLSDRELRVLRGMMDEYEYERTKRRIFQGWLGDARLVLAALGAIMLLILQTITLYLSLAGRR